MTDRDWSPRVDRKFLQRLFKDNGASCGTRVFGSPPDYASTSIKSFPYLIDLFVAGFDAAGQECWEGVLLERFDAWEEAYENPGVALVKVPDDLLQLVREEWAFGGSGLPWKERPGPPKRPGSRLGSVLRGLQKLV